MLSNSATHCHVQAHPPNARTSKQDISKHPSTWSNISSRPPLGTHSFQTSTSTIDFSPVSAWKLPPLSASCLLQLANGMLQLPLSSSRLKKSTEEIQRLRHTGLHSMNSRSVSPIPVGSIAPSSRMSLQHQKHSHAIHSARPPLRLARRNIEFQFKVPHFLQVCDLWPGPPRRKTSAYHHGESINVVFLVLPLLLPSPPGLGHYNRLLVNDPRMRASC